MVYDSETLRPLHKLTPFGQETYEKILETEADRILEEEAAAVFYRTKHPVRSFFKHLFKLDENA